MEIIEQVGFHFPISEESKSEISWANTATTSVAFEKNFENEELVNKQNETKNLNDRFAFFA